MKLDNSSILSNSGFNVQPLYTKIEFDNAKSRQFLPLKCLQCSQTFYRTKHHIQILHSKPERKRIGFCSPRCTNAFFHPPVIVECLQCHKSFSKEPNEVEKSPHHFCSSSCAAKWNNAHKTKGTRTSKLEKWLQLKLPELYSSLEFHFNRTDAINAELDIYIPSLKLAFELNGIFHYEPIYGPEKLAKMQTNDTRKIQACLEHGIELGIIDVSRQVYFKEQSSMKFLTIIQNIIESKLSRSSPVTKTA